MAAQYKEWIYGRSLAGIAGLNPSGAWMSVCFECCPVVVPAMGRSLVQRSPTDVLCLSVIEELHTGGLGPLGAVEP